LFAVDRANGKVFQWFGSYLL